MRTHRIYFLKRTDGLIKIGTTIDLEVRMAALATGHGPLEILRVVNGGRRREQDIHSIFKRYWEYGEWFRSESGALEAQIESLDDGPVIPAEASDARNEWEAGEAAFMAVARERAADLVKLRQDRDLVKREAAIDALNAEHGLSRHFLRHILNGRAATVSAYGYDRLLEARRVEMHALVERLREEMAKLEQQDDEDILSIGRRLDEIEAELAERDRLRAIAAEIDAKKARVE